MQNSKHRMPPQLHAYYKTMIRIETRDTYIVYEFMHIHSICLRDTPFTGSYKLVKRPWRIFFNKGDNYTEVMGFDWQILNPELMEDVLI